MSVGVDKRRKLIIISSFEKDKFFWNFTILYFKQWNDESEKKMIKKKKGKCEKLCWQESDSYVRKEINHVNFIFVQIEQTTDDI